MAKGTDARGKAQSPMEVVPKLSRGPVTSMLPGDGVEPHLGEGGRYASPSATARKVSICIAFSLQA